MRSHRGFIPVDNTGYIAFVIDQYVPEIKVVVVDCESLGSRRIEKVIEYIVVV
jgi:hypothetical protein